MKCKAMRKTEVVVLLALMELPACTQPGEGEAAGPGASAHTNVVGGGPANAESAVTAREWRFGRTPLRLVPAKEPLAVEVRARAATEEAARLLVDPVLRDGAGVPTPAAVDVDLLLEVDLTGGFLCLHSSLDGEFDRLSVVAGEDVLADLGTSTNVEVTHPGHGWSTVTMRFAPSRISTGTQVVLTQHRAGAAPDDITRFVAGF